MSHWWWQGSDQNCCNAPVKVLPWSASPSPWTMINSDDNDEDVAADIWVISRACHENVFFSWVVFGHFVCSLLNGKPSKCTSCSITIWRLALVKTGDLRSIGRSFACRPPRFHAATPGTSITCTRASATKQYNLVLAKAHFFTYGGFAVSPSDYWRLRVSCVSLVTMCLYYWRPSQCSVFTHK